MKKRRLGKTDLKVSLIGMGGIPITRVNDQTCKIVVDYMLDNGVNFLDSAIAYAASEEMLGKAIEKRRQDVIIATKSAAKDYDNMQAEIELSLQHFRTDYIDLYQLHFVKSIEDYNSLIQNGTYQALLEAQALGKIGHIGITAHNADLLLEILKKDHKKYSTIQFPFNIVENIGLELFEKAKKEWDLGVIVMKPVAGGMIEKGDVSIKYILNNSNVTCAIPGTETLELAQKNIAAGEDYILTAADKVYIVETREKLKDKFCRRCGYCLPCPKGINIPFNMILEGYSKRYGLPEYSLARYESQNVKPDLCAECGLCETKCPYGLPIRKMLKNVLETFNNKNIL